MRSTDIQHLMGLKKKGENIFFKDCPQCQRFFGTNQKNIKTCSIDCDAEHEIQNSQIGVIRRERLQEFFLSKPYII